MKAVLDTNVFVSGIFFSGPPHQILKAWREGAVEFTMSSEILDEYRRVASILSKKYSARDLQNILEFVENEAEFIETPPLPKQISDDSDDEKFLACAVASGAKVIVSGDKHLLKVSGYQGIEVLKPRDFVDAYLIA